VATFTALSADDFAAIADAFVLGAVQRTSPIAAGTINSNFDITTAHGQFFVRVNEGKTEADVAWESTLVTLLARSGGVLTPPPLIARDGIPYLTLRGKQISVFGWRPGRHLAAREVTPERAARCGAALAGLHLAGLELPSGWQRGSIYDHDHLLVRYASFATNADPQLARAISVIGEELALAAQAAPIRIAATRGIIHGDLFRDNVLWLDNEITAILDFEQASGGSLAYDIAVCINDWCWDGGPRREVAAALLAGYQRVRPLPPEDRAALPVEIRAAAARFTITRITDVYLASVPNPEKDFRAFLARCEAWKGPALGQLTATL
jgi:homoserine kinase type II